MYFLNTHNHMYRGLGYPELFSSSTNGSLVFDDIFRKNDRPVFDVFLVCPELLVIYTKHPLKYGKNQADNFEYKDFGADFFPFFIGV